MCSRAGSPCRDPGPRGAALSASERGARRACGSREAVRGEAPGGPAQAQDRLAGTGDQVHDAALISLLSSAAVVKVAEGILYNTVFSGY